MASSRTVPKAVLRWIRAKAQPYNAPVVGGGDALPFAAASTWPRATGPVDVDHEAEAATVGAHGREYVTHTQKIEYGHY